MGQMGSLLLPIIVLGGMMFFMTRTQKKQQKQRQELLNKMQPGDNVITIGGLYGVISEVNTDKGTITLDCEGIFLEFERGAIKTVKPSETVTEVPVEEEEVEVVEAIEETTNEKEAE